MGGVGLRSSRTAMYYNGWRGLERVEDGGVLPQVAWA
jgi:hypothetical protein